MGFLHEIISFAAADVGDRISGKKEQKSTHFNGKKREGINGPVCGPCNWKCWGGGGVSRKNTMQAADG